MTHLQQRLPIWTAIAALSGALFSIDHVAAQDPATVDASGLPDLTPKRYKVDRYRSISAERSPFEIIVEEPKEEPPEDPPFEDYSLAGYSKRGNVWRVTVVSIKDPKEKHYLETGKVSDEGFELLNFEPAKNYKKSEIVVRRGGKSGKIGFSEKRLKAPTFAKGKPGLSKAPNKNTKATAGRTNATPARPGQPANTANSGKKTDAAAQIRAMLQNRANSNGARNRGSTNATQQSTSKRQPRRRVILPPK